MPPHAGRFVRRIRGLPRFEVRFVAFSSEGGKPPFPKQAPPKLLIGLELPENLQYSKLVGRIITVDLWFSNSFAQAAPSCGFERQLECEQCASGKRPFPRC
jgi:hypothetical protein